MRKNNKNKSENEQDGDNKDKKGKQGKSRGKFEEIRDKARKSKRKNVKVYLPAIIAKGEKHDKGYEQMPDEDIAQEMSEHEISYRDALLIVEIEKLAAKGLNDTEIINEIGISRAKFYERINTEPYFGYALNRHRGVARLNVENALYQNAMGFKYKEQQATPMGFIVEVEKQKLPETRAQEVYLYNRDKEQWKKKVEPQLEKGDSISNIGVVIKRRG